MTDAPAPEDAAPHGERRHLALEEASKLVGTEHYRSEWLAVDEEHLRSFGRASYLDAEHVNTAFSRNHPIGPALVDGFLLLSLLVHFDVRNTRFDLSGLYGYNYGLNRVRFTAPVMVGQRVRVRCMVLEATRRKDGCVLLRSDVVMELEGSERPAMVAEWLHMWCPAGD